MACQDIPFDDPITRFYCRHLEGASFQGGMLHHRCPFCSQGREQGRGRLVVVINPEGYFHGYFRCTARCTAGGFPLHFARLMRISLEEVPGYDPDREDSSGFIDYPAANINSEIERYADRLDEEVQALFTGQGIPLFVLREMKIGYNGRYLVYPYVQEDGNCYSARCVHPERVEDFFWYGDEDFFAERFRIFNRPDIERCENGTLVIAEGENNLLALRQLGIPGVAVPGAADLKDLDHQAFAYVRTLFLAVPNSSESRQAARSFAERAGYKVRILRWPRDTARGYSFVDLARDTAEEGSAINTAFRDRVYAMIREARSFSPFASPEKEYLRFRERLDREAGSGFASMRSGFERLDQALGGIHGINIVGGTPKAGKSTLLIQMATDMASRKIPVIYYDFENGRQKIYIRTLSRISRLPVERIRKGPADPAEQTRLQQARQRLRDMLEHFRVVTERNLTPELMRRHIDFLRHETNSDYTLVVVDSLHKLPFRDFTERRSGIDFWLRQLEAIRDELSVSFLVISELSRGSQGRYEDRPHMGSFKGSGDIEYSADNAMALVTNWDPFADMDPRERVNSLWLVASRENTPGLVADYRLDYPFWGFVEQQPEPGRAAQTA